jgi:hypothetical protein
VTGFRLVLGYLPFLFLLTSHLLPACGSYFSRGLESAVHERQEVLIAFHEEAGEPRATYVVSADYSGDASDFAWVMPLSGELVDDPIIHADDTLFRELEDRTEPRFTEPGVLGTPIGGCACSAPVGSGEGDGEPDELVTVVREGSAGIFDYVVLAADTSGALTTWLSDNGFTVPDEAEPYLERYVAPGAYFLAFKLSNDTGTNAQALRNTKAIQFTIQTDGRMYPLALSQVSTAPELEVVFYTLAPSRQEPVARSAVTIAEGELAPDPSNPSGTTYEEVFLEKIGQGGPGTVVVEYADWWPVWFEEDAIWDGAPFEIPDEWHLTRMRTILTSGEMDFDYAFQDSQSTEYVNSDFYVSYTPAATALAASVRLSLPASYLVWRLRRRHKRRHSRRPSPGGHIDA